jgi:uncharacterized protein (DUF1684 family)
MICRIALSFILSLTYSLSIAQEILEYQEHLNIEFADSAQSPLTKEGLSIFKELDFFPIDQNFKIVAKFIRTEGEKPFEMPTTTSRKPIYVKYGEAHFLFDGEPHKLSIYQNLALSKRPGFEDYLFLPFNDHTNGFGSYGGGRFMDLRIPEGEILIIDFNKAYNPYCAYNHKYSCPIPPEENSLNFPVKAGVMNYDHH